MGKNYTYDPRKKQMGGTPPPVSGQAMISESPTRLQEFGSDVRSFVKYPYQAARTLFQTGDLPNNFDKAVEAGNVESQPMDFAFNMINAPGAIYKGINSLFQGNVGDSAMNFASVFPFAKPLKAMGLTPSTAKILGKGLNKGTKATTLQSGGQLMTREQINEEIARINEAKAAEQERLAQFQQNIQDQLPNYATVEERNANPQNQKSIDSTEVIGPTFNYLSSLQEKGKNAYGCTSYGCGIIAEAGAKLHGDVKMPGSDRVFESDRKYPIFSGNAMMNSMIEANPAAMGMEVINPQSYDDLQPGDRIVSNYGTGGREGDQHTQIFSGEFDDQGRPIIMENMGGIFRKGISSRGTEYDFANPNNKYRITRYTGNMQNLNNELAQYQGMLDSGRFQQTPVVTNMLQPAPVVEATSIVPEAALSSPGMGKGGNVSWMFGGKKYSGTLIPSKETSTHRYARTHNGKIKSLPKNKKMQAGGFLSPEYLQRQSLFGLFPGSAAERQAFRLQGLQANSDAIVGQGSLFPMTPLTGQAGINQQRQVNRAMNQGMSAPDVAAGGAEKGYGFMGANTGFGKAMGAIPFGQIGQIGSGLMQASMAGENPLDIDPSAAGTAAGIGMAGQGAQLGMALGPIGAVVGGALGFLGGSIFGKEQHKKLQAKIKKEKENRLNNRLASQSAKDQVQAASVLSQYPTEGIDNYSYYAKKGGQMIEPDYTVEGGELMMAPANNPPTTDNNGEVRKVGPNMFKFVGDTHDAPSGGIGVKGGNTGFGSQTNQALDAGFVFSDRLKTNVDDYLKNI
jgi:hypothetical protein